MRKIWILAAVWFLFLGAPVEAQWAVVDAPHIIETVLQTLEEVNSAYDRYQQLDHSIDTFEHNLDQLENLAGLWRDDETWVRAFTANQAWILGYVFENGEYGLSPGFSYWIPDAVEQAVYLFPGRYSILDEVYGFEDHTEVRSLQQGRLRSSLVAMYDIMQREHSMSGDGFEALRRIRNVITESDGGAQVMAEAEAVMNSMMVEEQLRLTHLEMMRLNLEVNRELYELSQEAVAEGAAEARLEALSQRFRSYDSGGWEAIP